MRFPTFKYYYYMTENSGFNLVALQKSIQEALAKPKAKESCLLFE